MACISDDMHQFYDGNVNIIHPFLAGYNILNSAHRNLYLGFPRNTSLKTLHIIFQKLLGKSGKVQKEGNESKCIFNRKVVKKVVVL